MITSPAFAGKRYAVLGLARSGAATVEALLASQAEVTAWDRQDIAREPFEGRCRLADPLELNLSGFAGVVVSPGVPLNTHPIGPHAAQYGVPVIGDIELFALARPNLPPHKVVGITGTNGKSTTTALVHHILKTAGVPSLMGGNIGLPILAQDPLPEGGVYVLELSSYQIDLTFSLDCDVAVLLNITPDHLDRYDGFKAYSRSKQRLFEIQSPENVALIAENDPEAGEVAHRLEQNFGRRQYVRRFHPDLGAENQADWPSLQGPHNAQNAVAAIAICQALGLGQMEVEAGLRTYPGLPHRMERLCEHEGVLFVNDSKATNPESAAPALAAYPPDHGRPRIHWIVGGLPKEEGLGSCENYLGNIAAAYTVGEAGPHFAELLEGRVPRLERCELVSEAVSRAHAAAQPGDVVLLSPACASFDQFRDYEKRGEHFRQMVGVLTGNPECTRHESAPSEFAKDLPR